MTLLRFFASAACLFVLVACSNLPFIGGGSEKSDTYGTNGNGPAIYVSDAKQGDVSSQSSNGSFFGFFGGPQAEHAGLVVGDEPFAVKAGASVLAQGGSAADAATAMYFALSVTYPVAASLGGGGICMVHDAASGRNETFDFLARNSAGGGDFAVPGNVRGFAMLQSAYGALPWQRDVSPGEELAATGFPISRALHARLQQSADVIRLDAGLAAEFLDESGQVKPVNTIVQNRELAASLGTIRLDGPEGFYNGEIAQKLVRYASAEGGALSATELAAYRSGRSPSHAQPLGNEIAYLPPTRLGAGTFASSLLSRLASKGVVNANVAASETAAATKTTLAHFGITSLPRDLGATGFAATDANGQAVSCAVTMNGPFGSGHTAAGTGVTFAKSPASGQAGLSAAFLTPVIATVDGKVAIAGAGAGGPNGTAAIAYTLLRLARGEDVTKPSDLRSTGAAPYDTVNVITCQGGMCATLPDPGAMGLGAAAVEH